VAVGAEELQVLEPVVRAVTVEVVELHVQQVSAPFRDSTPLTPVLFEPLSQKAEFQMGAVGFPPRNQQVRL
jgi:hypothetical protein